MNGGDYRGQVTTTLTIISKRDGKLNAELYLAFSADGKTHTVTRKRANEEGKLVEEEIFVYERQ